MYCPVKRAIIARRDERVLLFSYHTTVSFTPQFRKLLGGLVSASKDNVVLPQLPSLSEALREAQEGLQRVLQDKPRPQPLGEENIPESVRAIRAARAREQMLRAEKEQRRKERLLKLRKSKSHYMQRRKKQRDRHYATLWGFYDKWRRHTNNGDRSQMSFEDFSLIFNREAPYKTGDPLYVFAQRVRCRIERKDTSKPWTLDNVQPYLIINGKKHRWGKLPKLDEVVTKR